MVGVRIMTVKHAVSNQVKERATGVGVVALVFMAVVLGFENL